MACEKPHRPFYDKYFVKICLFTFILLFFGLFKLPGGRPQRLEGFISLFLIVGATEATAVSQLYFCHFR
jgi:hypothetical protein